MDNLTLEVLAPYLPYGLKVLRTTENSIYDVYGANSVAVFVGIHAISFIYIKPILRPLSDLTNEIEHNGSRFVPWVEINKLLNEGKYQAHYNIIEYNEWGSLTIYFGDHRSGYSLNLEAIPVYQKLLSWHFDVFGLIDKGLGIDINSIEGKEAKGNV